MMSRTCLSLFLLAWSCCAVQAQRITRDYQNRPLSHVLEDLNAATDRYDIFFVYNDLEDFIVTCQLKRASLDDALRQAVGFYPVRIVRDGQKYYVECTYKTERHLRGTVVDEQSQPVGFANVAVLNPADSTVLSGGVTNEAGLFVTPYEQEQVLARISFVGYKTVYRHCTTDNAGTIRLQPETYTIGGVKVKGRRRIIKSQTDRLQYLVAADEFARGLDAQELMRRVPLLEVKGEEVAVVGKSATHFLLDGREMPDDMLRSKLKSLHAEDIERIEVISIPPSKYKAEPNAGYVNIVTRRDQTLGVNGSLGGSLVFKERVSSVLTPSLNYANPRLEVSFSGMLNKTRGLNDRTWVTTFADHEKTSDAVNRFDWLWGDANLLVKYQLSKQWIVGFLGSASTMLSDATRHDITEEWAVRTETDTQVPDNREYSLSGEVFADWLIDPKGKTLTLTYDYLNNYSEQDERLEATSNHVLNMQTTGDSRYRIDALKADLTLAYPWVNIETGLAYTSIRNHSALNIFSDAMGMWGKVSEQSNEFRYKEQTAAAYLSAHHPFSDHLSAKVGLRMEKTWIEGLQVTNHTTNRDHYLHVFPTVHVSWSPSDKAHIGMAYSKGIARPDFMYLNPFRYYTTPTSYFAGNPFLVPGLTDNVEMNFSNGRGLYAVLYESHQSDALSTPTVFTPDGMQSMIVDNCLSTDKTGLYVSWQRNLLTWWNFSLGGEAYYAQSIVTRKETNLRNLYLWSGKVELGSDWFLNRQHTLVLHANYTHIFPHVNWIAEYKSIAYLYAQLRYSLLGDRLRLHLSVSDPFHQNISRSTSRYTDYTVYLSTYAHPHSVTFYATYQLGGNKVRHSYRQSKNTDASRASGGSR